ncbi:hypothetical protein PEPS_36060 (plasmid) [Persicobacter psychrovividus]|uniref:Leucine rich repeat (LRR) protein n=2 Tax=Persicobacter psychrovividus TaxID=387638 RepID=A0ABN6LEE1_9BACT|nr:hypothetical protein PEPS_36060 [Persicobacter psychrovividus]
MNKVIYLVFVLFTIFTSACNSEKKRTISKEVYEKELKAIKAIKERHPLADFEKNEDGLVRLVAIDSLSNGEIPVELLAFSKLKVLLLLHGDNLSELPDWICNLPLSKFFLSENNFKHFPQQLLKMQQLEVIDLADNPISVIQTPLNFPKLKKLYLQKTKITKFPIIKQDPNSPAIEFFLSKNSIDSIPDEISTMKIKKIWMTDCNHLSYISPNLGKQDSLEELNFRFFASPGTGVYNPNSKPKTIPVPKEIAHCKNLKSLNLGHNKLTAIPNYVFEIETLEDLQLWGNQISEIPEKIVKLQKLRNLTMDGNELKTLPKAFGRMPNLQYINVQGNAISKENLPVEMFDISREKKCRLHLYMNYDKSFEGLPVSQEQFEKGYEWY